MKQFILDNLVVSSLYHHIVVNISIIECEAEVSHSIDQSKLIRTGGIVYFTPFTFNFLIFGDHSVTNTQTLNKLFQIFVI